MRRWQSHKIVEAEPITSFADTITNKSVTAGEGINAYRHEVPENFFGRGKPEIGDYLVRYDTGKDTEYLSWSPRQAFEEGYTLIDLMGDNIAVSYQGRGFAITREEIEDNLMVTMFMERASKMLGDAMVKDSGPSSLPKPEFKIGEWQVVKPEPSTVRDKLVRFLVARIAKFEEGYDASDALRMEELSWLLLQAVGGNIL